MGMWFGKRQKIIRQEIETINMRHIYTIFFIVILIVVTSCHTIPQDTAVLSEQTQAIVNFFLEDTEKYLTDSKQLVIKGGYIENDSNCFYLTLWDHDTSVYKLYGKYNGMVHYKGYDISLYGDSWNDFFGICDTVYEIPDMNNPKELYFYDPIEWCIVIGCEDTTIYRQYSMFPVCSSLSYEENKRIICDSLQKIIYE